MSGQTMATDHQYRILITDGVGKVLRKHRVLAADDSDAIRRAAVYRQENLCLEIWKGQLIQQMA